MNLTDNKYTKYALCHEMMETGEVIRNFNVEMTKSIVNRLKDNKKIMITGEGSSLIFPGKHFRYQLLAKGVECIIVIEGATQSDGI